MAAPPFHRALVIRGGALGDFLLTLPVLHALREAAPEGRLEVLAYPGVAALARAAGMVDDVRSIEYGPLAGFFTRGGVLDPSLKAYFGSFDLVLSYLYDPDDIFAGNLREAGVSRILAGPHRPGEGSHAIDQLAAPLARLGLPLAGRAVELGLSPDARPEYPLIAVHPGSGSAAKNWPPERWQALVEELLRREITARLAIVGGEADGESLAPLRELTGHRRVEWWESLPLPQLASRLAGARVYVGHDTGVSHLAAAVGTPSLLLFGPTDPGVWAPPHAHVRILRSPEGQLAALPLSGVLAALRPLLSSARLASGGPPPEDAPR